MKLIKLLLLFACFLFVLACSDETETETVPVETTAVEGVPVSQLLTKVNIGTTSTLAIKPRSTQLGSYSSSVSGSVSGDTCDELGSLDSDYVELSFEGPTPCFSEVEIWEDHNVYAEYYVQDPSQVEALFSVSNVVNPVKFSVIIDSDGNVHYLPGKPIKRNTFKNAKLIKSHNGKPHYINSSNKLVRFDMSTDTEVVLVDDVVSGFSIKNYSDGDHFIIDSTSDVKRIKPDGSKEILGEITKGQWYDIGGSIQYVSGGYLKNIIFGSDGNITDRVGYSNPVEFNDWIISGIGGMPRGINFNSSISLCTNNIVNSQRVMICGLESYNIKGSSEDIKMVNWCDYGDCGFLISGSIRICTSDNFIYFYGDDDNNTRLTWINNVSGQYRDILTTHKVTDLECVSDSEIVVIGESLGLTQTLKITDSDTISPVISVIDSNITNIITQ